MQQLHHTTALQGGPKVSHQRTEVDDYNLAPAMLYKIQQEAQLSQRKSAAAISKFEFIKWDPFCQKSAINYCSNSGFFAHVFTTAPTCTSP